MKFTVIRTDRNYTVLH